MSNWQYLNPQAPGQNGGTTTGGGGGMLSGFRSIVDARRAAVSAGRTPEAEYPDGYLGNVNSRRDDRLLKGVQSRLTQRSYQRGVHKGERIDPSDYYWKGDVNPQAGLEAEARGLKWTQQGSTPAEQITRLGENMMLSENEYAQVVDRVGMAAMAPKQYDPTRSAAYKRFLPSWR